MPSALFISQLLLITSMLQITTSGERAQDPRLCSTLTRCRQQQQQGQDSISYGQVTQDLTSLEGTFKLGFFERGNSSYLGIWYSNTTIQAEVVIVWVANRGSPMPLQSYFLKIARDGNGKVFDSNNHTFWSTNYSSTTTTGAKQIVLKLSDQGNLVLMDRGSRGGVLWQSFDNPTDTFLPGMDISQSGVNLVSWRGTQDPAPGNYLFQKGDISNSLLIYNTSSQASSTPYWDSTFSSLYPNLTSYLWNNITGDSILSTRLTRLVMSVSGSVQLWELNTKKWIMIWTAPKDQCDLADTCGNFGVCDTGNWFRCKCLPGFDPNDPGKWDAQDFSSGCSKRTNDQCGQLLLTLPMVKLPPKPDFTKTVGNETDCRRLCLNACGRTAYSFDAILSICLIWSSGLTHIQEEYNGVDAQTLHIRVNQLDIESGSRTCSICGTNMIPYPLSTNKNCGDPAYLSFQCNTTKGQVYFKTPSGKLHKVSLISPNSRKFVVQLAKANTSGTCSTADINSRVFNLNNTSPFSVESCRAAPLNYEEVVDVELSWKPPPPPACNLSVDCRDWPETTCKHDRDGKNVCMCEKGLDWDSVNTNCTKVHHKNISLSLKAGVATGSGIVLLLLGSCLFILGLRRKRATQRAGLIDQFKTDDIEDIDIPFIDYESILAVTDSFSDSNKLGAGGFGPVYKGTLPDGTEVAVKRLSTTSAQGNEEFRNEVILIAKLQHRNLVRVLGYCMKEDEKILIYEYMPNKCLSSFIFYQNTSHLLDWTQRFNIILGIARGLVYLHQDSRLRIIHRDLKPSNILLDEELNPKISDFGLARIVAGNDIATSTSRVVGTYGYMSPEYALDGYFSIKSDVYSFGIILLEVISGRKCSSLFQSENILISLLGYAWMLWEKEEALELVDGSIKDSCDSLEVKRCINVGLLCVQEDPSDRPTMSTVLLMLGAGDTMSLLHPNQPVFVIRRPPLETGSSSSSKFGTSNSNAELSTTLEGR